MNFSASLKPKIVTGHENARITHYWRDLRAYAAMLERKEFLQHRLRVQP
jgi:hypothetical protein